MEDGARPCLAELGGYLGLESAEGGEDVVIVGILVASFDPDLLTGTHGVVAGVSLLDGLLEESGRVGVYHYCGPGFPVEDRLADLEWVVVEVGWIHGYEAEVVTRHA